MKRVPGARKINKPVLYLSGISDVSLYPGIYPGVSNVWYAVRETFLETFDRKCLLCQMSLRTMSCEMSFFNVPGKCNKVSSRDVRSKTYRVELYAVYGICTNFFKQIRISIHKITQLVLKPILYIFEEKSL